MNIPLTIPNIGEAERKAMDECLRSGWVSTAGPQVHQFEKEICRYTGAKYAVALNSGSAALFITLKCLGVGRDDLVIVPDWTFVATANVVVHCGARPLLMDVDPHTGFLDTNLLEEFLEKECRMENETCIHKSSGKKIRFAMPVHTFGAAMDIPALLQILEPYSIGVIEDAAAAMGTFLNGRHAGTMGIAGCISFNGNKIMTTGSGGAVITDNRELAENIHHLSSQARTNENSYFHDKSGHNLRMNAMSAALGLAQLKRMDEFLAAKKYIHEFYSRAFQNVSGVELFHSDKQFPLPSNYWVSVILAYGYESLRENLTYKGIGNSPVWTPLHLLPMFGEDPFITKEKKSDFLFTRGIMLPSSTSLTDNELEFVVDAVRTFYS